MSSQSWVQTLINAAVDGTALTNSTTPTSIIPAAAVHTLPANDMVVGKQYRLLARGRISTLVTTPGTLTFDVRLGAVTAFASGALALNIVAKTNVSWLLELLLTCRAIGGGTSANLMGLGQFTSEAVIGSPLTSVGGSGILLLPASAPAVGTGFDSTASQAVDFRATWSVASTSNSIQLHQYSLESMN